MRRSFILLLIGGVVGLAAGLYLGWVQFPLQTINAPLQSLSPADKLTYAEMIAEGYQVNGDLNDATRKIARLGVPDVGLYIRQSAETLITTGGASENSEIRALSALAIALGQGTALMQPYVIPRVTPNSSSTATLPKVP